MQTLLSAQSISYATDAGALLQDLSFTLCRGDRIGLLGHNGCGKSTLLKLLAGQLSADTGSISQARECLMASVEQYLPPELHSISLLDALLHQLPKSQQIAEQWRAEALLAQMGFCHDDFQLSAGSLSGGQHTKLLLARALVLQPDLLLLDEPSNHLDLPTLIWLEQFLQQWSGSFVLVSHDQHLLDQVTNTSWIMRDKTLHCFQLPCSLARQALQHQDQTDEQRHLQEQKEIDRVEKSAKRLKIWGDTFDNEKFSRKAKHMEKRVERLKEQQTELSEGTPWQLELHGQAMAANRLLALDSLDVIPANDAPVLFNSLQKQVKAGDKIAIIGANGCGKSSLLKMLFQQWQKNDLEIFSDNSEIIFHPQIRLGYYDQQQQQVEDHLNLLDALYELAPVDLQLRKISLIRAGFAYDRHQQKVASLSGGERARLLFIGLSLARYHLLMLDEPTNHLDLEGKEQLAATLQQFSGGFILVSHDRQLIEQSCYQFWLIENGQLVQYQDLQMVYQQLQQLSDASDLATTTNCDQPTIAASAQEPVNDDEDSLLERLIELEDKLQQDLARKTKHQKPLLQQQWQEEIERIQQLLS